jgi:hypothetical protein
MILHARSDVPSGRWGPSAPADKRRPQTTPAAANSSPKRRPCSWRFTTWTARQGGLLLWTTW